MQVAEGPSDFQRNGFLMATEHHYYHRYGNGFLPKYVQSNPVITTSVYETPRV